MNIIVSIIILGWLAVLFIQIFRPPLRFRKFFLIGLSTYFLYISNRSVGYFYLLMFAVLAVFIISRFSFRKKIAPLAIIALLSIFIFFKLGLLGSPGRNSLFEIAVPVGLSFILFHSISFLIDRMSLKKMSSVPLLDYMMSALYFTTISAGPFHKVEALDSTIEELDGSRTFQGYCFFCFGVFKIALSGFLLKPYLLGGMPLTNEVRLIHSFNILLLSSIYLFSNFSGYSDVVRGLSKMMGFDIPINFSFPFLARSMAEFWRHWHISLGKWFREYVFLPVSYKLSKLQPAKIQFASRISLFITFFLIGIWHQFSTKEIIYAVTNASLVAFFDPQKIFLRKLALPITFLCILGINGLFLSENFAVFCNLVSNFFSQTQLLGNFLNLKILIFCFAMLFLMYCLEKSIDLLDSAHKLSKNSVISINFFISFALLFVALTLGLNGVSAVYVGY